MKRIFKLFVLFTLANLIVSGVFAQPDSGNPEIWEEVTDTPVNTGLAVMVVAGIGYGLKKLKQYKK